MIPVMRRQHQRLAFAAVGILLMIVISTQYLNMDSRGRKYDKKFTYDETKVKIMLSQKYDFSIFKLL